MPKTATIEQPPLMDLDAVARRLGVNHRHIRRLVAERRIPYLKWGHLLRFDPVEIAGMARAGSTTGRRPQIAWSTVVSWLALVEAFAR